MKRCGKREDGDSVINIQSMQSDAERAHEFAELSIYNGGAVTVAQVESCTFEAGMCYLFFTKASDRGPAAILWGVFDCKAGGVIRLEVATTDLSHFKYWVEVTRRYCFVRLMTPAEMRDFCYSQGYAEASSTTTTKVHISMVL